MKNLRRINLRPVSELIVVSEKERFETNAPKEKFHPGGKF